MDRACHHWCSKGCTPKPLPPKRSDIHFMNPKFAHTPEAYVFCIKYTPDTEEIRTKCPAGRWDVAWPGTEELILGCCCGAGASHHGLGPSGPPSVPGAASAQEGGLTGHGGWGSQGLKHQEGACRTHTPGGCVSLQGPQLSYSEAIFF